MSDLVAAAGSPAFVPRDSRAPAVIAAGLLHAALLALLVVGHPRSPPPLGSAVPITILASEPLTDSRAAEAAPETQTARAETPISAAKPPTPAPTPAVMPKPAPPASATAVAPKPSPSRPTPAAKPLTRPPDAPAVKPRPAKPFSLDALQADVAKATGAHPARPAFAARGPTRAETASRARPDAGPGISQAVSGSDMQGLQQLLERLWNPNCEAPGGDAVIIPIHFQVGDDGRLMGRVVDVRPDAKPVVAAAARRAIDAVHEAEPYAEAYRGKAFTVNFDAHKACAGR